MFISYICLFLNFNLQDKVIRIHAFSFKYLTAPVTDATLKFHMPKKTKQKTRK